MYCIKCSLFFRVPYFPFDSSVYLAVEGIADRKREPSQEKVLSQGAQAGFSYRSAAEGGKQLIWEDADLLDDNDIDVLYPKAAPTDTSGGPGQS